MIMAFLPDRTRPLTCEAWRDFARMAPRRNTHLAMRASHVAIASQSQDDLICARQSNGAERELATGSWRWAKTQPSARAWSLCSLAPLFPTHSMSAFDYRPVECLRS